MRVVLHVEVDRAALGDAEVVGAVRGVVRGLLALRPAAGALDQRRGAAAPVLSARRLAPDVDREELPALSRDLAHPVRAEVAVRAGAVRAADVDPGRAVGGVR